MTHAIIIEGYGTGSGYECANAIHAERLTEILGEEVHYGCAHIGEPDIDDVIEDLAYDGPDEIVVFPMYFAESNFTVGNTMKRFHADPATRRGKMTLGGKEVQTYVARVFTDFPEMDDFFRKRAEKYSAGKGKVGFMMVGHGSRTGENNSIIKAFGERLGSEGYDVVCCTNEFAENNPTVDEALRELVSRNDEVVVIPMFISPNHHYREEVSVKLGLSKDRSSGTVSVDGKDVKVLMTEELGVSREITPIILKSIRESGFL
jgi:sirohydrochlorin ferrochelatase